MESSMSLSDTDRSIDREGVFDSPRYSHGSVSRRSSRSRRRKRNDRHDASPPSSSSRRLCGEDRISKLPDCLLVDILSRLPTNDAVKTTLLSKRWFEFWTLTTRLDFRFPRFFSCRHNPHRVVSSILMFHKKLNLEKFSVSCYSDRHKGASDVDLWLRLMTSAKVKDLTLDFLHPCVDEYYYSDDELDDYQPQHLRTRRFYADFDFYNLPRHLYLRTWLTNLRVSMCGVNPDGEIRWDSLKSLAIGHTVLDEIQLKRVLEGSPMLEALELYHFGGIDKITSDKLKVLIIRDDRYYTKPQKHFVVSAPNLQSLTVKGDVCWKSFHVLNASTLIHCQLDFSARYDFDGQTHQQNLLNGVMGDLLHVKELSIGPLCVSVLARMEMIGGFTPTCHRCKLLTLETRLSNMEARGVARLL